MKRRGGHRRRAQADGFALSRLRSDPAQAAKTARLLGRIQESRREAAREEAEAREREEEEQRRLDEQWARGMVDGDVEPPRRAEHSPRADVLPWRRES
jgi:hypothetical protein